MPQENSKRLSAILVLHGIAYRGEDGGSLIHSACDEAVSLTTPPVLGLPQAPDSPISVNNASVSVDKAVDVSLLLRRTAQKESKKLLFYVSRLPKCFIGIRDRNSFTNQLYHS